MGRKKLTYEFVKSEFEKEGYTLVSTEYINNSTKLDYICPQNHEHNTTWDRWSGKHRCPSCRKLSIKFIMESFEKENYILLNTEYKHYKTKLDYICPNGHQHSVLINNWLRGSRCPYCSGKAKYKIEDIMNLFKLEDYTLLSTEYKNSETKLNYICPEGHNHNITFNDWLKGTRCGRCFGTNKPTIEFIREQFEKEDYTLLSTEYKSNKTKLHYICPKGHRHTIKWVVWQRGSRCFYCKTYKALDIIKDSVPIFKTYAPQIDFTESVREFTDDKNRILLEVKCKYCQKWFIPKLHAVQCRIRSINSLSLGESNFYCSQECKDSCSTYNIKMYPKGFNNGDLPYTQHELYIWADTVKAKCNYICEICGDTATDAHHIKPKKLFPNEALDIDNGVALCHSCHIKHGHSEECSTGHLASIVCTYSNSSTNSLTVSTELTKPTESIELTNT